MWQCCLFGMDGIYGTLTRLGLIGRRLDDTVSGPSALQSSCSLTFDPSVDCAHLAIGLVCVGGAYGVPQVPVPQTCQSRKRQISLGSMLNT